MKYMKFGNCSLVHLQLIRLEYIVAWYLWYKENTFHGLALIGTTRWTLKAPPRYLKSTAVYDQWNDFKCSSQTHLFLVCDILNEGLHGKITCDGSGALEGSRAMKAEDPAAGGTRRVEALAV